MITKTSRVCSRATCTIIFSSPFSFRGQFSIFQSHEDRQAPNLARWRDLGQSCRREDAIPSSDVARRTQRGDGQLESVVLAATTLTRVGYEYANDVNSRGRESRSPYSCNCVLWPRCRRAATAEAHCGFRSLDVYLAAPQAAIFRRLLPESGFARCTNLRYFQEPRPARIVRASLFPL